jgi:hypothetical protein
LKKHVAENSFKLQQNLKLGQEKNGLVILEAYYGLDEHIYQVDAGLLLFKIPKDTKEYYDCQLVPLKKYLTIKIDNSKLVINR